LFNIAGIFDFLDGGQFLAVDILPGGLIFAKDQVMCTI
jgi:hypothetical protein